MRRCAMEKSYCLVLATFLLQACAFGNFASTAQPLEGVIRNYNTGEPIPDAFVVARWFVEGGNIGHGGNSICFHVEVTKSDAQGRYYFPVPEIDPDFAYASDFSTFVNAYKPDYRWVRTENGSIRPVDQLVVSTDKSADRIDFLLDVRKNVTCMRPGDSEKNLLGLYKSLYAEVDALAVTREEKISAISILQNIEGIELGGNEASKRFYQRLEKIR